MKKRIFPLFAVLVLVITSSATAIAAENNSLRSSPTLAIYSAKLTQGSRSGNIIISYDVSANTLAEEVGVATIKVYEAGGDCAATITGSIWNNLLLTDSVDHRSSYTYKGTSGTTYYTVVTVTATIDGVTDTRDITTNSVTAP